MRMEGGIGSSDQALAGRFVKRVEAVAGDGSSLGTRSYAQADTVDVVLTYCHATSGCTGTGNQRAITFSFNLT